MKLFMNALAKRFSKVNTLRLFAKALLAEKCGVSVRHYVDACETVGL